jgi:hypothetical protein
MALGGTYQDFHMEMFKDNLEHELQQSGSLLTATVTVEAVEGNKTWFTKYGKASSYVKAQRGQLKTYHDDTYERRLITFVMNSSDKLLDVTDGLDMVKSPKSDALLAMVQELGRARDAIIFTALSGSATKQETGSTSSVSLPAASKVAVNSHKFSAVAGTNDIGLTPSKLKEALKLLGETYVDATREPVFVVGPMNQLMKLAVADEVIRGGDFNRKNVLDVPGIIPGLQGYLGLNFIAYEETDLVNTSDETVYVYPKSAVKLGVRKPLAVKMGEDFTRTGNPEYISAFEDIGAVRMFEEKVIQIACDPNVIIPA